MPTVLRDPADHDGRVRMRTPCGSLVVESRTGVSRHHLVVQILGAAGPRTARPRIVVVDGRGVVGKQSARIWRHEAVPAGYCQSRLVAGDSVARLLGCDLDRARVGWVWKRPEVLRC